MQNFDRSKYFHMHGYLHLAILVDSFPWYFAPTVRYLASDLRFCSSDLSLPEAKLEDAWVFIGELLMADISEGNSCLSLSFPVGVLVKHEMEDSFSVEGILVLLSVVTTKLCFSGLVSA